MKKLLSIIAISLITLVSVSAQTSPIQLKGAVRGTGGDTITNTGTVYDSIVLQGGYRAAVIEVNCTKISGTLGGKLTIQGRLINNTNSNNWRTLQDTATVTNTSGTKSYFFQLPGIQPVDNVASYQYPVPPVLPYYQYRILWTGTGTMVGWMKAYAILRQ